MRSKVYFIKVSDIDTPETISQKFIRLLQESKIFDFIKVDDSVAVKMHFGEEANTGYVKPEYVRLAVDGIIKKGAKPFVADTNTLYRGRRMFSEEHLRLAHEHGFTERNIGAPVLIADEKAPDAVRTVKITGEFIKIAKILSLFCNAGALVGIAHFKGHVMTGFGGALKNLGMGCASREGKLAQHSDLSPIVNKENCTGCGECEKVCPVGAIKIINKKSHIDSQKCIGCASCIAACKFNAIDVNWESGGDIIQEKVIEYAKAVLLGKEKRCAFINFAIKITAECDCLAGDDPKISPDLGILASYDPLSIDQASLDLVIKANGKDVFKEAHPNRDGTKQLRHAARVGLGSLDYELIEV